MPLISDTIPNLTGGVSQQADNLRYSNTAETCENAMLSPVTGMQKRQAAEWLGEMHPYGTTNDLVLDDKTAVHWINRDATEHYALVMDSNGLRAYDADTGQALQVVLDADADAYLKSDGEGGTTSDFASALRFTTVADTTFVANRNVTVLGSTAANFRAYHFAAFPQLAYDQDRGGAGVYNGVSTQYRTTDYSSPTTYSITVPSFEANELKHVRFSETGNSNAAFYVHVSNDQAFANDAVDMRARVDTDLDRLLQANVVGQVFFIPQNNTKYAPFKNGEPKPAEYILEALDVRTGQTKDFDTRSAREIFYGRHVSTSFLETPSATPINTIENGSTSTSLNISLTCLRSETYGPNGTKTSFFGRTISTDIKIENGFVLIGEDDGTGTIVYREPRINDHSSAKIYDGDAVRPFSNPDVDFDNAALTGASWTTYVTNTTATYPGGTRNIYLFNSAFMPNHSAQLTILNDLLWVIAMHRGDETDTASGPRNISDAYVPSSVAPIAADGFSFSTIVEGSTDNSFATFQDLPGTISSGTVYKVGGTANGDGAYYVIGYDGPAANDERYIETYDTPFVLDDATLPIKIQRTFDANGNPQFVASLHQYSPRVVGDDDTNALPSFVNNTINDIFVHAGRLGFLSGESLSLSSTVDFGTTANFFRGTVTQLLDNDRIDLNASTGDVAQLQFAVPFANTLLLMSERAQYRLVANGALTPATSIIQQTGAHATTMLARPQRVGKSVFAAVNDVVRTTVREFRADIDTDILESNEVTTQVPKFIPPNVHKIAYSAKKNLLVALSHTNTNCLYVYNYYDTANQRLQSAWSKWLFDEDTRIINVEVIEDYLHAICAVRVPDYVASLELANSTGTSYGAYQERTHVIRIPINEITEARSNDFPVLADFRVTRSQCVAVEGYRQGSDDGLEQASQSLFQYKTSALNSSNLLAVPLPDGLDFSVVELPYKTTATDIRTIFTDADAYGISPPLLAAMNFEIVSSSSQTAFQAATAAFLQSPTQANANALNAIVVNTQNTKVIVIGRLDGVFLTDDDRVLNNITTAVTPNFMMGRAYTLTYEQSPIFYKAGEANVGKTDARLQLRYCTVTCDETSSFDVEVTTDGRQTRKYDYEAFKPGVADFTLGSRRFASEAFRFPVFAQNQKCKIVFKNNTVLPSTLTSLEWQGFVSPKAVAVR